MAVAISHTASFEYADDGDASHSQAGVAIGSAAADRLVFVFASGLTTATGEDINTLTVGGVSATRVRRDQVTYNGAFAGAFQSLEIWWAPVPTGTTAAVAFVHNANLTNAKFSIYAVTGANTTTPVSDHDGATRSDALTNALSVSVDVPENGGAIGLAAGALFDTAVTAAWTYLTENLDNDHDIGGVFIGFSTAAAITGAAAPGQAVTATLTGTGTEFNLVRGISVVTISAAAGGVSSAAGSSAGTGAAQGSGASSAATALSAAGSGTATGGGGAVAASVFSMAGTGTLSAVGEEAPADRGAANISGTGALTGASASIASATFSLSGSGSLAAASPESEPEPVVTFPPVGGGGGLGPSGYRQDKQRFRTRKDKSHPKVITVRIGNWPEDPQIILERREQAERDEFYQSFPDAPFEEIVESGDDEEAILLAILAIAA